MTLKQFKHELRVDYNSDKWGEVMSAWFECAAHLQFKGGSIPYHWQYRPHMPYDAREKDNYYFSIFSRCSVRQLTIIGNFLCRLSELLTKKGFGY